MYNFELEKNINICFSDSLKEVLNDFNKELQVFSIQMIFDIGNLNELENLEIHKYLNYSYDDLIEIQNILIKINNTIEDSIFKNFVFWYSEDSNEYSGMLYFFHKIRKINNKNIYLINCSQRLYLNSYIVNIKKTSEIRKEFIPLIVKGVKKMDWIDNKKYIKEIKCNFTEKGSVRIYDNGKITTRVESELSRLIYDNLVFGNSVDYNIYLIIDRFSFSYNVVAYIIKKLADSRKIKIKNSVIIS